MKKTITKFDATLLLTFQFYITPPTPNCSKNFISALTITRAQWSQVIMHLVHGGNSVHGDVTFAPNHVLDQGYQDLVHLVGNSCYLSAARRRRGRVFFSFWGGGLWEGGWEKKLGKVEIFFSFWIWAPGQRLGGWGER